MPKKEFSPEQIFHKLREAEVLLSQSKTIGTACKKLGVRTTRIIAGEKSTVASG
jgi:hypothetical protein